MLEVITIVALVTGPVLAVLISLWAQKRSAIRGQRLWVFQTLMACRMDAFNPERIKALGMIDVIFHNAGEVRARWKEYYEALGDPAHSGSTLEDAIYWRKKQNNMLAAMAQNLGFGKNIGMEEIERAYAPKQFSINAQTSAEMQAELLRVLKASKSFGVSFGMGKK